MVTCNYFPFFVTGLRWKSVQGIAMDTFPVTIQSLFEGKSTGILRTTKLITDTVIIQLFKSFFILEIYSILFLWNSSLVFCQWHWEYYTSIQTNCIFRIKLTNIVLKVSWGRGEGRRRRVRCMDPGKVLVLLSLSLL